MDTFRRQMTNFLQEWIFFPKCFYTDEGYISEEGIRAAIEFLFTERVFETKKEIREIAMKDYGIFIPEKYFPKEMR